MSWHIQSAGPRDAVEVDVRKQLDGCRSHSSDDVIDSVQAAVRQVVQVMPPEAFVSVLTHGHVDAQQGNAVLEIKTLRVAPALEAPGQ
jgi:hypothetical protein